MVFRDRSYSVLLVCGKGKFDEQVMRFLPYNEFYPVRKMNALSEARRELIERSYDIVIVNWQASDSEGKIFACDMAGKGKGSVLLMVDNERYGDIYFDVVSLGVFCIPRRVNGVEFSAALRMICSSIEKEAGEKKKQQSVEEKMAEIRLVNKTKWALIEKQGMTEEEAHKYIERYAMDRRIGKAKAAEELLKEKNM